MSDKRGLGDISVSLTGDGNKVGNIGHVVQAQPKMAFLGEPQVVQLPDGRWQCTFEFEVTGLPAARFTLIPRGPYLLDAYFKQAGPMSNLSNVRNVKADGLIEHSASMVFGRYVGTIFTSVHPDETNLQINYNIA